MDALAVGAEDGSTIVLRIANWQGARLRFSLRIAAAVAPGMRLHIRTLRGESGAFDEENTPGEPCRVAPHDDPNVRDYKPGMEIELPDLSFSVLTLTYDDGSAAAA